MPRHHAVMFDLDGTLADTLGDIAASANRALEQVGAPPRPVDDYRYLAGQGVDYLIQHALGPDHAAKHDEARRLYLARYAEHKYDRTGPFPGIPEVLDELTSLGVTLAVLSNKPDDATRAMMRELFGRWRFDVVRGAFPDKPLKPDPAAARAIADELGISPQQWLYVGDTKADMLTGSGAGMTTIGVLWGFRDEMELRENGADAIISEPAELLSFLDGRG